MEGGECNEENREKEREKEPEVTFNCTNPECTRSRPNVSTDNPCAHIIQKKLEDEQRRKEKAVLDSGL